jgi:hypothetical protein
VSLLSTQEQYTLFLVIEVPFVLILFILMFGGLQGLLLLLARDGLLPLLIVIVE